MSTQEIMALADDYSIASCMKVADPSFARSKANRDTRTALKSAIEAQAAEIDALRAALNTKNRWLGDCATKLRDANAKLSAMEAVEPVAWTNASWLSNPHAGHFSARKTDCFNVPLYAAPKALEPLERFAAANAVQPQAQGEAEIVSACRDLIAYLDKTPPMGESIWAIQRIRTALRAAPSSPEDMEIYKSIAANYPQATEPANAVQPTAQEPVAWMYQCTANGSSPVLQLRKQNWAESGSGLWIETPLYAAPQQAQEPQAQTTDQYLASRQKTDFVDSRDW